MAENHDIWRGLVGLMVAAASSVLVEEDLTGEKVILGLLNLKGRSPGDYRAPSVQTPYAFLKRHNLCPAPSWNNLKRNIYIRTSHTTTHLPFLSLAQQQVL